MYVLLFFACSFLGWCMEVTCKLVQFGRFINRGFLLGPLCPIYGTGAVLMAYPAFAAVQFVYAAGAGTFHDRL